MYVHACTRACVGLSAWIDQAGLKQSIGDAHASILIPDCNRGEVRAVKEVCAVVDLQLGNYVH